MREQILYYAYKYEGDWKRIESALRSNESWASVPYGGDYTTIEDEDYPACFRELEFPPWILFYEGNIHLCHVPCCGIVGSRLASAQGMEHTKHITNILKEKYVIVSGLAKGIDAIAHKSALTHHTIGVIGCGLDVIYPKENAILYQHMRKHQLLLSEYPYRTKPYASHFPWRNRLIAALSENIIVIEAKQRSGTMLTVNEAIALDRNVYCVPHDYGKEEGKGCNLLISQGAEILVDDEDIYMI